MRLLDVNVLLAISLEAHEHHSLVREWMLGDPNMVFATCAVTEISLLRLLMNPVINENPVDAVTGVELLASLHRHPRHRFLEKIPSACDERMANLLNRVSGYRQITDAFLVAIAKANGCKLATLDRKLEEVFEPADLEIIQSGK